VAWLVQPFLTDKRPLYNNIMMTMMMLMIVIMLAATIAESVM